MESKETLTFYLLKHANGSLHYRDRLRHRRLYRMMGIVKDVNIWVVLDVSIDNI